MRFLYALEQNSELAKRARAELYTFISSYLLMVTYDFEYAVYYMTQAAKYIPKNPEYIWLIRCAFWREKRMPVEN